MASAKEIEETIGISENTIETWSRSTDAKALLSKFLKSFSKQYLEEKIAGIVEQECLQKITKKELLEDVTRNIEKVYPDAKGKSFEPVYKSGWEPFSVQESAPDILLYDHKTGSAIIVYITSLIPSRQNFSKRIQRDTVFSLDALKELFGIDINNINSIEYIVISKSSVPERVPFRELSKNKKELERVLPKDTGINEYELGKALSNIKLRGIKIQELASIFYSNKNLIII